MVSIVSDPQIFWEDVVVWGEQELKLSAVNGCWSAAMLWFFSAAIAGFVLSFLQLFGAVSAQ